MTALLNAEHLRKLVDERSIAPALVMQRGYQSLPQPDDLIDRGFSKAQAKTAPALGIPLWDVHGHRRYWQIRPDSPRQFKDGRLGKYELPKGEHLILDVHPSVQPLIGNPHEPLWITEGIPKGDSLASRGVCALALNGVRGYRGTNDHGGKVILPDWESVALNGREVFVVYDSDIYQKPEVEAALQGLYAVLRPRGAIPRLVVWPEAYRQAKIGVDDYLAQGHGLDELLAMVPPMGPLPQRPPSVSRNGHRHGHDAPSEGWCEGLLTTKSGEPLETLGNIVLALQHLEPWQTQCWYDAVRDIFMVDDSPLTDTLITQAKLALERTYRIPMRSKHLVPCALMYLCFQRHRDLLREWFETLAPWDQTPRLTEWLHDCAHAPKTAYGMDVVQAPHCVARRARPDAWLSVSLRGHPGRTREYGQESPGGGTRHP